LVNILSDLRKLAAIPVKLDKSFFILLIFIPFLFGTSLFGINGLVALPMLFFFVLLHEYGHCWAAQKFRYTVSEIRLGALGGVATLEDIQHASPKEEILVSIAGPAVNFIFALLSWIAIFLLGAKALLVAILAMNLVLGIFNLIPAFPMDGGRILRAIIYHFTADKRFATRISAKVGLVISIAFFILGLSSQNFMLMMIFGWIGMICYQMLKHEDQIF
jgi:Zn-dependent protease